MEETKKLSCIDCNVKKCNVKQNIENHKPYPGFCVSHNMDLKDRQMALDTYLGDEKDLTAHTVHFKAVFSQKSCQQVAFL